MAKGKTSGTKPTGPNSATQGKPLGVNYSKPCAGPVDTPNSNGQWDASAVTTKGVHTAPVKGSKKSF